MIDQGAIQKILGINDEVEIDAHEMIKHLEVTFYPKCDYASASVKNFAEKFEKSLTNLGVKIIPYDSVWEDIPILKRIKRFFKYTINNVTWICRKVIGIPEVSFFLTFGTLLKLSSGRRIKRGVCIICVGEQDKDLLPMQYIASFKTNSIITIVDFPEDINESSNFSQHFDAAMSLFAYHMTNIAIAVNSHNWMVYNFNASHPIYPINNIEFDNNVLSAVIPKVVAPISPHTLKEFMIIKDRFDINDPAHKHVIEEMRQGARIFARTGLYPKGKNIDGLPFRQNFHRLIGKLHLDNRSGMSFGFIAFQMPTKLLPVQTMKDFINDHRDAFYQSDVFVDQESNIFIAIEVQSSKLVIKVPDVWVMTLRSGSDKTNFDPNTDLLKMGLVNGKMCMQLSDGLEINRDYKPSFDTKVILAHAIGNAIIASISDYLGVNSSFVKNIREVGISISHWHGYFNKSFIPNGLTIYGRNNPHVSCSSPQSAIYALTGKLNAFAETLKLNSGYDYIGDVHIEPHHGVNISYPSLTALANYILENPGATELGNKYL